MRRENAQRVEHAEDRAGPPPRPDLRRTALPDQDARRQRMERTAARILWGVNLFGLIMLLVVFIKLDGLL